MEICGEHGAQIVYIKDRYDTDCPACEQIEEIKGDHADEINDLTEDNENLQSEIQTLEDDKDELNSEIEELRAELQEKE